MDIGPRQQVDDNALPGVYALLVEASARLRERGLSQWTRPYPADRFAREVVARKNAGQGIGKLVLDQLEGEASTAGIRALRLDVVTANPFLQRYYAARGFQHYETVPIFGEPCALLERMIPYGP